MTSVGTGALIFSADGQRVLLLRYAKNGEWGRPGGRVESGESARAACVREVREEVGVDLDATPELRDALRFQHWAEGALLRPVPIAGWVAAGFAVRLPDAALEATAVRREPEKHDAMAWVPVTTVLSAAGVLDAGADEGPAAPSERGAPTESDLVGHVNAFTVDSLKKAVASGAGARSEPVQAPTTAQAAATDTVVRFPCSKCGERGHFRKDCPRQKRRNDGPQPKLADECATDAPAAEATPFQFPCGKCGERGHFRRDCPQLKRRNDGTTLSQPPRAQPGAVVPPPVPPPVVPPPVPPPVPTRK
uniref:Nudix hydrolase domain-containing protein n=1 Tax=Neobodo designis TaxID=312471 RepID=A0A7S1MS04_NEODS